MEARFQENAGGVFGQPGKRSLTGQSIHPRQYQRQQQGYPVKRAPSPHKVKIALVTHHKFAYKPPSHMGTRGIDAADQRYHQ